MEQDRLEGESIIHHELSLDYHDPLIRVLHRVIRASIKVMAILMAFVIVLGVVDVGYNIYDSLKSPPLLQLSVGEIFQIFGAFMVVLIAIEIFINIRLYLGSNTLPIKMVVATALMAIARKVIVLDLDKTAANEVLAIGMVTLALGVTYWLVGKSDRMLAQEPALH
jgi:uncharacterized membrane protein (DUF373 family)